MKRNFWDSKFPKEKVPEKFKQRKYKNKHLILFFFNTKVECNLAPLSTVHIYSRKREISFTLGKVCSLHF
jgi:hypothetical protein